MSRSELDPSAFGRSMLALIQRFVGNDTDALERMRQQVESELQSAELMAARAREQLAAIDELRQLLEAEPTPRLPGMPAVEIDTSRAGPSRVSGAPSLRNAIQTILDESDEGWTRDRLLAELDRRGWGPTSKSPRNTVNSRLFEMVKAGTVHREGDAFFATKEREVPT